MNKNYLEDVLRKIDEKKKRIAKERDSLNEIYSELEEFLIPIDEGIENIDEALIMFREAIEKLSEQI